MSVTVEHIVFDAAHAQRLATFWAEILGRDVDLEASEYSATVGRSGSAALQPVFIFLQVPEERAGKNRLHVDLASEDRRAEVERAVGAGATHVGDFDEYGTVWTTLRDPEGNVFDIAQPHAG